MNISLLPTILLSLAAAAFVYAANGQAPEADSPEPPAEPEAAFEEVQEKPAPSSGRARASIFVPTEEVGADAEVDFPAGL